MSLTVNTTNVKLKVKDNQHIFAIAHYSNGDKINVNKDSQFKSANPIIAEVDSSGNVMGKKPGTTTITVNYGSWTKKLTVVVQEQFPRVNVKSVGAVGDGIHDDTAAFQKAIDQLSKNGGGEVYIPSGIYILQPIKLKEHVNLLGENRDNVILKLSDKARNGQTRLIEMDHNTKIQQITCDGNYQHHPNGSEHMHCIFVFDKNNIVIENNKLMNAVGDGISISGSTKTSNYIVIANNIVQENQRSQIVIEQVNHLRIMNNTISSKTGRPGIHFEPWEKMQFYDAKIFGNTITTNSTGYCGLLAGSDSALAADTTSGYFFHGIEFYQNTINAPAGKLLIEDTMGISIHDNVLTVSEILLWRKNRNATISNNEIKAKTGVYLKGVSNDKLFSEGATIIANKIHSSLNGVEIEEGSQNTLIKQNIFTGSGNGIGVNLIASEGIKEVSIVNNHFQNYRYGIETTSYSQNNIEALTISDNQFSSITGFALFLTGEVQKAIMKNNMITNGSGVYIWLDKDTSMSAITITGNHISGGKQGIFQDDNGSGILNGLTITENTIENTSYTGRGATTGAAIEIQRYSTAARNVLIANNILRKNAMNKITVPDKLKSGVKNNSILP
ncbi:right-handed parallel beta-helix repeat-containing protein [Bacillus rubiinfantis]|uniref:right-handed parallel beta-helix repeat-containing protein n=1 Tax=Bacillus rubiinfantis TaxID=1499680 RepID=UPI0005AA5F6A|nr:right-handed parallel beta-helix repeat-containing protein [Bacillus rubiinfantis]